MNWDTVIKDNPCWDGYEQIGMKEKNGKQVPNCVPIVKKSIWLDVLKRKRGNRRKRVPYNPFTGEGDKQTNIEDRLKARDEKTKKREAKVAESFKKVPRARITIRHGGGNRKSSEAINRKMAFNQNKKYEEGASLNPRTRCAMCSIKLTNSNRTKTLNNAADLNYCAACARTIEGKPVASRRTNAKGDFIPYDNPNKRRRKK